MEVGEFDGKVAGIVIRLAFGVFGVVGVVSLLGGLCSWLNGNSADVSIWQAMVGDEPYCRFVFGHVQMGGGYLWRMTPDGMLPAICGLALAVSAVSAAVFNRLWIYIVAAVLMFLSA